MEPTEIELEELEIKYSPRLLPDDKIIAKGGATAVKYRYRLDYALSTHITFIVAAIVFNIIPAMGLCIMITNFLEPGAEMGMGSFAITYFITLAFWLAVVELLYQKKFKEPDYPQYFFLTTNRLFINNKKGEYEIPFKNIKRVEPLIYDKKNKALAIIKIYETSNLKRHTLYAGADEARVIHEHLTEICKRNESENRYGF